MVVMPVHTVYWHKQPGEFLHSQQMNVFMGQPQLKLIAQ